MAASTVATSSSRPLMAEPLYLTCWSASISTIKSREQIADQVIALLDQRFPGLAAQVEMRDVATPITWESYIGNWRASHEGWLITTKNLSMRLSKTLPGLKNFYMVGQWVDPGGSLPYVAVSGRNVTQIICKQDKRKFVTTTP